MLETTDAAATMDLSEWSKKAVEVLGEAMTSVYCIYHADFRDLEELREAGKGETLAKSVHFLLCGPPYDLRRQSGLENTIPDVFKPNEMDDFCDPTKMLIKLGGQGHVFCFVPQSSSWW